LNTRRTRGAQFFTYFNVGKYRGGERKREVVTGQLKVRKSSEVAPREK